MKYFILDELFNINREFKRKYGEIVICLDNSLGGYWRKDVYHNYKANRKKGREVSEINYDEVFEDINILTDQISRNLPWKVVDVRRAEADDAMLVLSRVFSEQEKILIHSPDKDMIQAQRGTDNVFQYSSLTKKWIVPENKHDNMESWILEHVCLGDAADEVPKVIDHTEFSPAFLNYLDKFLPETEIPRNPFEFRKLPVIEQNAIVENFDVYKKNRKGESTGVKDIFLTPRFGPTNLKKTIEKFGSLDKWLDSHPLYRKHYDRNFQLVMEEGIPQYIYDDILLQYKNAETDYNMKEFEDYLKDNQLSRILTELPNTFKIDKVLTGEDYGW